MELVSVVHGLEFIGVRDEGNLAEERLLLRVPSDIAINNLVLLPGNTHEKGGIVPSQSDVFWLPDATVKAGNIIRIYTKRGAYKFVEGKFGNATTTYYNLYWDKLEPVWLKYDALAIVEVGAWNMFKKK